MTSIEKHTPTPWYSDPDGYAEYIWGPKNQMVAQLRGHGAGLPKRANAEFIVCAVNAHDALLAACKAAQSQIKTLTFRHPEDEMNNAVLNQISEAIALAVKGQT